MREEAAPEDVRRAIHDRVAFAVLYDLYLPRVYAFCHKYGKTREDAEDLTAETFEKALAAIARYEDRGQPFSAWLLRIAANTVIDRARRSRPVLLSDQELDTLRDDRVLAEWDEAYWLRMHIAALPADQREAIRLRFYEDQRFADMGKRLGRSEGAAKQLLRRALTALHGRITDEMAEDLSNA
jgi:RNA polymerase sigma-70 factor (ECF subfamily)